MEKRNEFKSIMPLIFRALGLAMGVAAVVLNLIKAAPLESQALLLGFGVVCLAMAVLVKEERDER